MKLHLPPTLRKALITVLIASAGIYCTRPSTAIADDSVAMVTDTADINTELIWSAGDGTWDNLTLDNAIVTFYTNISTEDQTGNVIIVEADGVNPFSLETYDQYTSCVYYFRGGLITVQDSMNLDGNPLCGYSRLYFEGGIDLSAATVELGNDVEVYVTGDVSIYSLSVEGSGTLSVVGDLSISTSANISMKDDTLNSRGIVSANNLILEGEYNTFSQLIVGEFQTTEFLYLGTGEEEGDVGIGKSNWLSAGTVYCTGVLDITNVGSHAGLWPSIIGSLEGEGSLSLSRSELYIYNDVTLTSLDIDDSELTIYGDLTVNGSTRTEGAASDSDMLGSESILIADNIYLLSQGESSLALFQTNGEIVCSGDLTTLYGGDLTGEVSYASKMTCSGTYTNLVGSLGLMDEDAVSTIGQLDMSGLVYVTGSLVLTGTEASIIDATLYVDGDLTTNAALISTGGYKFPRLYMSEDSVLTLGGSVTFENAYPYVSSASMTVVEAKNIVINYAFTKDSPVITVDYLTYASSLNLTISDDILSGLSLSDGESCALTSSWITVSDLTDHELTLNGDSAEYVSEENEQTYTLSLTSDDDRLYVILTAEGDLAAMIEWISTDGVWDTTVTDWLSGTIPTESSTIYFVGDGELRVELDGDKTVSAVNVSDADYTLTGDSLTTASMKVDGVTLSLENDVTVNGSLNAANADIVNNGTLSIGDGSDLQSLSGSGSLVVLDNATAIVDSLEQSAVTIQSGASLQLGSADVSLASLNNTGSLTTSGSLSLTVATTTGGDVNVGSLLIVTGSTFGDVSCSLLSIEGSLSASDTMLTVSSLSGDVTLDLVDLDSTIAAGTYDIITGVGALTWDDFTLSDATQLVVDGFENAYKELEWIATDGTLQLVVTSVIPAPDSLTWDGGTGTADIPIVWDDDEANWTGTPDGWEGTFIPSSGTDITFDLSASTYISLDGDMVVEDTTVTNSGSGDVSLNLSGGSLTTDSLTSTGVDIVLSNTTVVEEAITLYSADLTVSNIANLTTDSLIADADSSFINEGITIVEGALTADVVTNDGTLSVGDETNVTTVTGQGVLIVLTDASARVEHFTQDGLNLQEGASLSVGSANTSDDTTSIKVLANLGSITLSNALVVETITDVGGDVTAPSLQVKSGSIFGDLLVDSLTIDGSITTSGAALTVDSLATLSADTISLDVSGFSSDLDNGTYTIIAGDSSLEWTDFTISQAMLDASAAIAEQERVVQWVDSGDSLQIVILAGSPRYWSTSNDYSLMVEDGQSVDGSEKSLFVSAETGEIVSYTNFQNLVGVDVDADALIDLSISLAPTDGQSLQLTNMTGQADATLTLRGTDTATHSATLYNDTATEALNSVLAENITVQVKNADGASLTLASLQLSEASLTIADGAELILQSISDADATSNSIVNDGSLTLSGGTASTVTLSGNGSTTITSNSEVGLGSISKAALVLEDGSTLTLSEDSTLGTLTGTGTLDASTVELTIEDSTVIEAVIKADSLIISSAVTMSTLELGNSATITETTDSLNVASLSGENASISNEGTLSLGDGSHVGAISGDGVTIVTEGASVVVDTFDSSSLTLESGSTIIINSDATLLDLDNLGTLVMENNTLTLGAATSVYGIMTIDDDSSMTTSSSGNLIVKDLIVYEDWVLDDVTVIDSLTVDKGVVLTVNSLNSENENSTVSGEVEVVGTGGVFAGTYSDAVIALSDADAEQTLATSGDVALSGSAGTFILTEGSDISVKSLSLDGGSLDMTQLGVSTLDLVDDSTIANSEISLAFDAATFVSTGAAQVVFSGADLTISDSSVILSALDESSLSSLKSLTVTEDVVILELGSNVTINGILDVDIEGTLLSKYLTSAKFVGTQLVVDINTTFYEDAVTSGNGAAGMTMISSVYDAIDPQRDVTGKYDELSSAMSSIDAMLIAGNHSGVNNLSAAMAGSSTTAMGSAMMSELERQLRSSNRRALTEAQPGYGGKGGSAWIAAESNFDKLSNDGTYGGHHLNSYGGSIGVDLYTGRGTSFGLSFTAMKGDLSSSAYDSGDGSLDTQFLSLYGRVVSGNWKHSYAVTFGWGAAEMDRTVSHANGYYKTTGDSDTQAFGALYEVGYSIAERWSLIANAALQNSSIDAYRESGSDAGLRVGKQESTWGTFGFGVNLETALGETAVNRTCSLNTRAMLKAYAGDTGSSVSNSLLAGGDTATVSGTDAGKIAIEFAAGLLIPVNDEGSDIFVDASVLLRDNQSSVNVTLGYRFAF